MEMNTLQRKRAVKSARVQIETFYKEESTLFDPTITLKKKPIIICRQPKTIIYVPYHADEEYINKAKAKYYDQNGRFKVEPVHREKYLD